MLTLVCLRHLVSFHNHNVLIMAPLVSLVFGQAPQHQYHTDTLKTRLLRHTPKMVGQVPYKDGERLSYLDIDTYDELHPATCLYLIQTFGYVA